MVCRIGLSWLPIYANELRFANLPLFYISKNLVMICYLVGQIYMGVQNYRPACPRKKTRTNISWQIRHAEFGRHKMGRLVYLGKKVVLS